MYRKKSKMKPHRTEKNKFNMAMISANSRKLLGES